MRNSNDQTLKQALEGMLKAFKLDDKLNQVKLVSSWEKVLGAAVARRTTDLKIINRKLYASLDSASLRDQLFRDKEKITGMLNEEAGCQVIDEIIFR